MKRVVKRLLQRVGYDIQRMPSDPAIRERIRLLNDHGVTLILDIGANEGQYAKVMRACGYTGRVVSFEPLPDAYAKLKASSAPDPLWITVNSAVGDRDGVVTMNISQNSYSSSILNMLPRHLESAPDSRFVGKVGAPVCRVDTIFNQYCRANDRVFLKIDTQGYDRKVIEGCSESLKRIVGFQLELSLAPLYEGETLMPEMVDLMRSYGYVLLHLEGGHRNYQTGELLQVEGIFYKN